MADGHGDLTVGVVSIESSIMSSSKPKTGGLAALLRLEKERLAREASDQESSNVLENDQSPSLSSDNQRSYAAERSAHLLGSKKDTTSQNSLKHEPSASHPITVRSQPAEDSSPTSLTREINTHSAQPSGVDDNFTIRHKSDSGGHTLSLSDQVKPLLQTREPSSISTEEGENQLPLNPGLADKGTNSIRSPIKTVRGKSSSRKYAKYLSTNLSPELRTFVDRWKPFLTETQLNICIYIYNNSTAVGLEYCFTSTPKLMSVISKTERQIKTVLNQLITLQFITRGETIINAPREKRGTFYKLNVNKP